MNIIACSPENNSKTKLNTITTLQGLPNLAANSQQRYIAINHNWYIKAKNFKNKPLLSTFEISYYQDNTGEVEINYNLEHVGIVYIKIIADPNDINWNGSTSLIAINLERNLNTITSLIGMAPIHANTQQKYHNINPKLYNQAQAFNYHPLVAGFTVHYFTDADGKIAADDNLQAAGDIYVKITAAENDQYWMGITDPLKLTFSSSGQQINLNTIKTLEGMPEVYIISNQQNKAISKNIYNQSKTFKAQPLAAGFIVHYFTDANGKIAADDNFQIAGELYVIINAAPNDPNWTGTSYPLKLSLSDNRPDLNTITDLTGMDRIIVNPNLTYQQINKNVINSSNQLKVDPLSGNFTIQYFSDKLAKHAIDNYYQQIGTVYVIITPDYQTGTKWKANKIPITFPIEKG